MDSRITVQTVTEDDLQTRENFNSTNHHELSPYILNNDHLILDINWWNREVLPSTQTHVRMIAEKLNKRIIFDHIKTPHGNFAKHQDQLASVYHAYLYQYDYHIWADLLKNPEILPQYIHLAISKSDIRSLYEKTKIQVITNRKMNADDLDDFSPTFVKQIQDGLNQILQKSPTGVFVKLSSTSGKNEQDLKPLKTVLDVINFLTNAHRLFTEYESVLEHNYFFPKHIHLVMLGWIEGITGSNEFRVFIYEQQVVGISQQSWYKYAGIQNEECSAMASSIVERYHTFWKPSLPFKSVVLDVYVKKNQADNSNHTQYQAHVIECNPWGAYHASGSSLFHWKRDYQLLHNTEKTTYFRYVKKPENKLPDEFINANQAMET